MSDGIEFDFSELQALAADLGTVPGNAGSNIRQAVEVTSRKVKDGAKKKVGKRHKALRHAAVAIDYDIAVELGDRSTITSEIGYNKDKAPGPLGNLIEFGAPGAVNALTPGNELQTALHEQESDFEAGLSKALEDAERKAGL